MRSGRARRTGRRTRSSPARNPSPLQLRHRRRCRLPGRDRRRQAVELPGGRPRPGATGSAGRTQIARACRAAPGRRRSRPRVVVAGGSRATHGAGDRVTDLGDVRAFGRRVRLVVGGEQSDRRALGHRAHPLGDPPPGDALRARRSSSKPVRLRSSASRTAPRSASRSAGMSARRARSRRSRRSAAVAPGRCGGAGSRTTPPATVSRRPDSRRTNRSCTSSTSGDESRIRANTPSSETDAAP